MKKVDLKKLPMPVKSMPEQDASDDMDSLLGEEEGSPAEEAKESPAEEDSEHTSAPDLSDISDDDLVAELKKRGLIADDGAESK